jgi:pimeloyl-ACP methyl ester carboxylesterase
MSALYGKIERADALFLGSPIYFHAVTSQMKIFIDNGFLEYDLMGQGLPMLFIHGYPLSRKIWIPQMVGLADIAQTISIDLRGHGDSYPFIGPYSMDLLADDCKYLLDNITKSTPLVVCGLSMGGYIAMALYRKYPELFIAMVLTSTRSGPDTDEGKPIVIYR